MISLYREVVNVIISDRKLDDITYTEHTLSLLVKHMPGILFSTLVGLCQLFLNPLYTMKFLVHADVAKSVLDECIKPGNWDTEYYKETCEVEFDYDLLKRYISFLG